MSARGYQAGFHGATRGVQWSSSRITSRVMKTTLLATVALLAASPLAGATPKLVRVAAFEHQVTGVTVERGGRIFVNFPRWTEDTAVSVGEVKGGAVVPFPDPEWNAWRNAKKDQVSAKDHWVCVQSVVADEQGHLWVLDPAAPAMGTTVKDGPKLVEIDLATNRPARTIAFDESVAPQGSYLNDVRFSPDGKWAYLTDSGARGALVVIDLSTGNSRRVLDGDPTTQPDKTVTVTYAGKPLRRPDGRGVEFSADGIALSTDGKTLYWQAIKGKTLYRVATSELQPGTSTRPRVETVGDNGPADGLWIGRSDGRMYITSPQDDSIKVRALDKAATPTVLVKDARLRWPDTLSEGANGTLFFTTSHIQDSALFKAGAPAALRTELWSLEP